MWSVQALLIFIGLGFLVASIYNKVPLWVSVLFLYIIALLSVLPLRG